jgi:hypothetical protein
MRIVILIQRLEKLGIIEPLMHLFVAKTSFDE